MLVARWACDRLRRRGSSLEDLDWRAGWSVLRGKASREDGIPLPPMSGRRWAVMQWWSSVALAALSCRLDKQTLACGQCADLHAQFTRQGIHGETLLLAPPIRVVVE